MADNSVIFKGTKNGINIILKEDIPFEEIKRQLQEKIISLKSFLSGSKLFIKFSRELNEQELKELLDIIVNDGGVEILMVSENTQPVSMPENISTVSDQLIGGDTNFYRGTLRSGQSINFYGNVVITGDVNGGAEIIAGGNVIVLGMLRGAVHAGVPNNNDAFVFALNFQPTQLRIGEVITRAPEGGTSKCMQPEIAVVKENMIYIESMTAGKN